MRLKVLASAILMVAATAAWAQGPAGGTTARKKTAKATKSDAAPLRGDEKSNVLKPPPGAKVAIVVFEDLQCPDCARAAPLVKDVSKAERIPVVRHDFPLPMHNWSFQAAIIARWFDAKSKGLGDEWREFCFANQPTISPDNLSQTAQKFAQSHGTALPFMVDPTGALSAKVRSDFQLGQRIGIQHTPTLFVVTNSTKGEPFVEVLDRSKLTEMIEDAKRSK